MSIVASIALTFYLALLFGIACWKGIGTMHKHMGLAFMLIAAGFLHSMATKPAGGPTIAWDDYIANNGSYYTTNGVTKTGVYFAWRKTEATLPNTTPLRIMKAATNSTDFVLAATTTVGAFAYTLTLANPDAFHYSVEHDWIPPTPVHTNGVWLGQIIEKAKNEKGLNKLIVIQGELQQNGKVIAP